MNKTTRAQQFNELAKEYQKLESFYFKRIERSLRIFKSVYYKHQVSTLVPFDEIFKKDVNELVPLRDLNKIKIYNVIEGTEDSRFHALQLSDKKMNIPESHFVRSVFIYGSDRDVAKEARRYFNIIALKEIEEEFRSLNTPSARRHQERIVNSLKREKERIDKQLKEVQEKEELKRKTLFKKQTKLRKLQDKY